MPPIELTPVERVSLKSVKRYPALLHESIPYSANVYLDGKKIGTAMNDGHGGPDMIRFDDRANYDVVEQIAKDVTGETRDATETLLDRLVEEDSENKAAARKVKKGFPITVIVHVSEYEAQMLSVPSRSGIAGVLAEFPDAPTYRIIDANLKQIDHPTLAAFTAAYPRVQTKGQKASIFTDGDNDQTLLFIHNKAQHSFTDTKRIAGQPRLFQQFVDEYNNQIRGAKAV